MKTSPAQFEIMVKFMEEHGDLSKPASDATGRIVNITSWEHLSNILNSDGGGDTKNTEKWKKVWSDFKNNTKKKVARLHRAASGTFGGPTCYAKLTDLEQRVLNLIGVQGSASLLPTEEFSQSIKVDSNMELIEQTPTPPPSANRETSYVSEYPQVSPATRLGLHTVPSTPPATLTSAPSIPSHTFVEIKVERTHEDTPIRCLNTSIPVTLPLQPSPVHPEPSPEQPALSGHTKPCRGRPKRSPSNQHRRFKPYNTEAAVQHFLHADEGWRKFKQQQHQDYMECRREQNRLRELEIKGQREWRQLGKRVLNILDKLVNKYCKD